MKEEKKKKGIDQNASDEKRSKRGYSGSSDDDVFYPVTLDPAALSNKKPDTKKNKRVPDIFNGLKGGKARLKGSQSSIDDDVLYPVSLDPDVRPGKGTSPDNKSATFASSETIASADTRKGFFREDENKERGNWSGRLDFILAMIGYCVGLGNIWRFPYLCYRNGGGAFLLPFLLMMLVIGVPLFFLEASLGQFCSKGPMKCWHFSPLFKGVGIAMMINSVLTALYYNMILAWAQFYLFASFTSKLPWQSCDNDWNTRDCSLKLPLTDCTNGKMYSNGTCYNVTHFQGLWNVSLFQNVTGRRRKFPSDEYWNSFALNMSPGIDDFGLPKWDLVLQLMLAWTICFLCLLKGIKTTGKVVYFTAIFPYVVLLILFFRGVTLPNAIAGIRYFIVPDFKRLGDARVWKDAANQIFFSMGLGGGGLMTLASYNRFNNNILRDSVIVSIGDSLTCVFGGFVIFSYLGYMAGQMKVDVSEVVQDGAGLAFIVYPEAVSNLPPPTLWSILFFFMLITLGLDSQFAMLEIGLTGVLDQYPHLRPRKTIIILIICIVLFLCGLPLTCPGGMYLLQLIDTYVGGMTLIIIGFFELIAIVFVYGAERFFKDITIMLGKRPNVFWKICWYGLSPVTIAFIFVFMFVDYTPIEYGDYKYPVWADALGWILAACVIIPIPVGMLYKICKEDEGRNLLHKLRLLTIPTLWWGPALPQHRKLVDYVEGFKVDPDEDLRPKSYMNLGFQGSSVNTLWTGASQMSLNTTRSQISGITGHTQTSAMSHTSFESYV